MNDVQLGGASAAQPMRLCHSPAPDALAARCLLPLALPWRVYLWYPACISHVSRLCISPYSCYPAVSLYRSLSIAILQQIQCIPLYPTVSSCIRTYLAISSCICMYPAVSRRIPPPRIRDMAKNTLQGGLPLPATFDARDTFLPWSRKVRRPRSMLLFVCKCSCPRAPHATCCGVSLGICELLVAVCWL